MYKLFIVEDDVGIAEGIKNLAEPWSYEVRVCRDFTDVCAEFSEFDPHIVLLDISLPFANGYHWCAEIRKLSKVPIIFISSASDNMNVVMAMSMGADDFIAKPFDSGVLMVKLQAILRRAYDYSPSTALVAHRGVIMNTDDGSVTYNGNRIELSKNEYKILQCLLQNKSKTVSREKLMQKLWETDSFIDENTLNVNVNRLRKKLESMGICDFITTKFGVGYIIE